MTQDAKTAHGRGGISTMIAHQDVCAQCGEHHPDRLFGLRSAAGRGCPNVLMGAFPVATPHAGSIGSHAVHRAQDADRTMGTGAFVSLGGDHSLFARKPVRSAIPWPLPTDVEEFL